MVDKIWYDWQNRVPMNKYAFGGGSNSTFGIFPDFFDFPTGKPPYLNVSSRVSRLHLDGTQGILSNSSTFYS